MVLLLHQERALFAWHTHAPLSEHWALCHNLKSCTIPILYRSDLVKSWRMLYHPDVCNCTMPYVPRTVPAYAVRDPAYTAEVFALTLVKIDVHYTYLTEHSATCIFAIVKDVTVLQK